MQPANVMEPGHTSPETATVIRVDVLPQALALANTKSIAGIGELVMTPIYWFSGQGVSEDKVRRVAEAMLLDPITESMVVSSMSTPFNEDLPFFTSTHLAEKQFLPGVTDNLGKTVTRNLPWVLPDEALDSWSVASGVRYWIQSSSDIPPSDWASTLAYQVFNPLVERLWVCDEDASLGYRFPLVGSATRPAVETIALPDNDEGLMALSRARCLALSLEEMHAIRAYFADSTVQEQRRTQNLPADPTDVELEILAQTWSEHCKHKIFAAKIDYIDASDPDNVRYDTIDGLFKTYIAGPTNRLMPQRPDLLSVFKDNAGVIQWDDQHGICFKVETHNSPSALEPYGGALTGIVGVNRDILGTGLGAKPLFNTDVFCFAHPDLPHLNRPTMLPAESILLGVRKGVEDGGNKSGIPTVNGSLFFAPGYRAKPLVFCGTGGLMPLTVDGKDATGKYTRPGELIVMAGGRVGKDGIHGATFSSEALHEESPVSAVQIGDPITQKRMLDFLMEARDAGLITGLTDNGAGGLSSSVGEMAELTNGAVLFLEQIPLKYPGLAPYEIVISESQERMTLSVRDFESLKALADKHDVEVSIIGKFHDRGVFEVFDHGQLVAQLPLEFLHGGCPQMQLQAIWTNPRSKSIRFEAPPEPCGILPELLKHPNICSREPIIRQYDHEVQGRSVIKPLMGTEQSAPCDAAVIQPVLGQPEGLAIANGLCPQYSDWDTYAMASCAVDEAIRSMVAVGADPKTVVLLDNFCWPDPLPGARNKEAEHKLAQLVRANQAIYDMALSFSAPFISGKDSMKNDFDDGEYRLSIPPTLLISGMAKVPDIAKTVTMAFQKPGDKVYLLGKTNVHLGGAVYYDVMGWYSPYCPRVHTVTAKKCYQRLFEAIQNGWIRSCHDLSEGGFGVALAECAIGSGLGVRTNIATIINDSPELRWDEALFSESPSRFVISISPEHEAELAEHFEDLPWLPVGEVTSDGQFEIEIDKADDLYVRHTVAELTAAWKTPPAKCYAFEETA